MAVETAKKPLKVVVIGGSLSGLMSAIALKHAGHNVTILEKEDNVRESHMSGLCLGEDAMTFLQRHDRVPGVFTHRSLRVQSVNNYDDVKVRINTIRDITSWDTYFHRLRANFDGYKSDFYPNPPQDSATDGEARYEFHKEVLDITRGSIGSDGVSDGNPDKVTATVRDRETDAVYHVEADLIIGADGPSSFVRRKYMPQCQREYAGYIVWRGVVPERDISDATREVFKRSLSMYHTRGHGGGQYGMIYAIPGALGTLEPGDRYLNFAWYTNETPGAMDEILKDGVDGHKHHYTVPAGRVRKDYWSERLTEAKKLLPEPFFEVMAKIQRPFLQAVTSSSAPKAAFEDGKVLLVGESLSQIRPHSGFSGTHAAFDACCAEDLVCGKISLQDWEEKVLRFGHIHRLQSVWFGTFFMNSLASSLQSAFHYWWLCTVDRVKAWWKGERPLLRTSTLRAQKYEDEISKS